MTQSTPPRVRLGYAGAFRLTGETAHNSRATVRRLLGYTRPYTRQLLTVAGLVLISTASGLAGPILMGQAIDRHVIPRDLPGLGTMILILLAIYLFGGVASFIHSVLMVVIGQKLIADMRAQLFNHLQWLSMAYHDQHKIGDLMSRVTNDTEAIDRKSVV